MRLKNRSYQLLPLLLRFITVVAEMEVTDEQREIRRAAHTICNKHCYCAGDFQTYNIICDGYTTFKSLVQAKMPNPIAETIRMTIMVDWSNERIVTARSDCSTGTLDTKEVCIDYKPDTKKAMEFVTHLDLMRLPVSVGTVWDPFLIFFPKVTEIKLYANYQPEFPSSKDKYEIYFVEHPLLEKVTIIASDTSIELHCAFESECLSDGVDEILFRSDTQREGPGALKFAADFKAPGSIKKFIYKPHTSAPSTLGNVFQGISFGKIELPYYSDLKTEDFEGAIITDTITMTVREEKLDEAIEKIFQTGYLSKTRIVIPNLKTVMKDDPHVFPIGCTTNKPFLPSMYENELAKKLLSSEHKQFDIYSNVIVVRGITLKLSDIKTLVEKEKIEEASLTKIYAYAFHLEVDLSVEELSEWEQVLLHYVYVTVDTEKSTYSDGIVKVTKTINQLPASVLNHQTFKYDSNFQYQFIHMNHIKRNDPTFLMASTMCLLQEIDQYYYLYPGKSLKENEELWGWFERSSEVSEFNEMYASNLEQNRAKTVSRNLIQYVNLMEDQITGRVARVPQLSMTVLEENIDILIRTGRYLGDKMRHLKTMTKLEDLEEKSMEKLQELMKEMNQMKLDLLENAKMKSETLADVEARKQKDIEATLTKSDSFIAEIQGKYDDYVKALTAETKTFEAGVKLAVGIAAAEIVAEAVGAILSIFSGGFNPSGMMKAVRELKKLKNIVTKLKSVAKTISLLVKHGAKMKDLYKIFTFNLKKMKTKKLKTLSKMKTKMGTFWSTYTSTPYSKLTDVQKAKWKKLKEYQEKFASPFENAKGMVESTVATTKAKRTWDMGFSPGTEDAEWVNKMKAILQNVPNVQVPEEPSEVVDEFLQQTYSNTIPLDDKEKANTIVQHYVESILSETEEPKLTEKDILDHFECNPPEADKLVKDGSKIGKAEVFKWRIAREHVIAMVDTTLSDDVPQATAYRGALLKFIEAGKTRTEEEVNRAIYQMNQAASKDIQCMYLKEALVTQVKLEDLKPKLVADNERTNVLELQDLIKKRRNEAKLSLDLDVFALTFEALKMNLEFCNAYYYFHLDKCSDDLHIRFSDDLERILSVQSELLYQSREKLRDIYPPPQDFTDREIVIKATPPYCECSTREYNAGGRVQPAKKNFQYDEMIKCFKRHNDFNEDEMVGEVDLTGITDPQKQKDERYKAWNNAITYCAENPIQDIIANWRDVEKDVVEFSHAVSVHSDVFSMYDRVRIDDVKVTFVGAVTDDGRVTMIGETTGVAEDKYQGKCFKFVGDKWLRRISYYSQATKSSYTVPPSIADQGQGEPYTWIVRELRKIEAESASKTYFIDKAKVHKRFEGVYSSPTVFATWSFSLRKDQNHGLDMSKLKEIKLKFSGSFVNADPSVETCQLDDEDEDEGTSEEPE